MVSESIKRPVRPVAIEAGLPRAAMLARGDGGGLATSKADQCNPFRSKCRKPSETAIGRAVVAPRAVVPPDHFRISPGLRIRATGRRLDGGSIPKPNRSFGFGITG